MTKTLPPFCHRNDLTRELRDFQKQIRYSDKYTTEFDEYRHVILPKKYYNLLNGKYKKRLLSDEEWRHIGICQSVGWEHYLIHSPEPHIFLFKRSISHSENPRKRKSITADTSRNRKTSRKYDQNMLDISSTSSNIEITNRRRSLRIANKEKSRLE